MRITLLFASFALLAGCADVIAVEGGELRGELGAVADLDGTTLVHAEPAYTGGSRVSLDLEAPDGRQLMVFVTLPEGFDRSEVGTELAHGTHYVEGEAQPISAVWGCSRQTQGTWDIDTGADGGTLAIVPSDTPGLLRARLTADFRLDVSVGSANAGELQTLSGWFDFVPR